MSPLGSDNGDKRNEWNLDTQKKDKVGASNMAQQIKALAVKPDDLNSIPGTS